MRCYRLCFSTLFLASVITETSCLKQTTMWFFLFQLKPDCEMNHCLCGGVLCFSPRNESLNIRSVKSRGFGWVLGIYWWIHVYSSVMFFFYWLHGQYLPYKDTLLWTFLQKSTSLLPFLCSICIYCCFVKWPNRTKRWLKTDRHMQEYVVVESKEKVLTNDHITDVIVYCGFIITTDSVQCFFYCIWLLRGYFL